MKTPEFYSALHKAVHISIEELVRQAQFEAIEVTVKACSEAAKIKHEKLNNSDCSNFSVDKQSILKVEQQLKAKL